LHAAEREWLGVLVCKLAKDHWYLFRSFASSVSAQNSAPSVFKG
jgi:hypothetical protein